MLFRGAVGLVQEQGGMICLSCREMYLLTLSRRLFGVLVFLKVQKRLDVAVVRRCLEGMRRVMKCL